MTTARPASAGAARIDDPNWTIVAVASVALVATSPGQTYIVSLFNTVLREALDLSLTTLSAAYLCATLLSASSMVWLGRFSDRYGPRRGMVLATLGLGLACAWMGFVTSFWMLVVGFFLLRFLGQAALSLYSAHLLALWFERRLGFVEGLRSGAFGIAVATIPAVVTWAIGAVGWRETYVGLGGAVWLAVLPAVWILGRVHPREPALEQSATDKAGATSGERSFTLSEARSTGAYWQLAATATFLVLVSTAVIFHLEPIVGYSGVDVSTALLMSSYAVTSTVIPLFFGWVADRVAARWLIFVGMTSLGGSCVLFAVAQSMATLLAAMASLGIAVGLHMITISPNVARYFGKLHHGAIRGSFSSLAVAGTAVGPLALGSVMEVSGGRGVGLGLMAGGSIVLGAWGVGLRRPEPPRTA